MRKVPNTGFRLLSALAVWAFPLIALNAAAPLLAQSTPPVSSSSGLEADVHLLAGTTKLAFVTAELSQQTGLAIEAAEYLRERRLFVQMDKLSARQALDALAALHDWTWTDQGKGHILITRRVLALRQDPATIPRRMQAALPRDMRVFLGIASPYQPPRPNGEAHSSQEGNGRAAVAASIEIRNQLLPALMPNILDGQPVPYARLTHGQQEDMAAILLFAPLSRQTKNLLADDLWSFVSDPTRARLTLNGTTLLINERTKDGGERGFGAEVKP